MYRCEHCGREFYDEDVGDLPTVDKHCPLCGADAEDAEEGNECRICSGWVDKHSPLDICDMCFDRSLSVPRVMAYTDGQEVDVKIPVLLACMFDEVDIEMILRRAMGEGIADKSIPPETVKEVLHEAVSGNEDDYIDWLRRTRRVMGPIE